MMLLLTAWFAVAQTCPAMHPVGRCPTYGDEPELLSSGVECWLCYDGYNMPCADDDDRDGTPNLCDCMPAEPAVHPEAEEIYDGRDTDCDGEGDASLECGSRDSALIFLLPLLCVRRRDP